MTIFDSQPHALVAISRHTAKLTYYLPGREHAVTRSINGVGRKIRPIYKRKIAFRTLEYVVDYSSIPKDEEIRTPGIVEYVQKVLSAQAALTQPDNVSDAFLPVNVFSQEIQFSRMKSVHESMDVVTALQTFYGEALPGASSDCHAFD
ncbi:hypothetical protein Q1695_011489 [Nippostrongylus brasiliensis]|nr:hypothetical protein Q1695_011489 [Nippostrongylus brasiliensis]